MGEDSGGAKRRVLLGTDYVYPRTTNKILRAFLKSKGVAESDIMEKYTPFGHSDWQTIVASVKSFAAEGKKTAVVSTINGDANVPFYKELANQGIKAEDIPVVAFSVGEEELAGIDTAPLVGHLAAWNYFMSVETPENEGFIEKWQAFIKSDERVTNDPMEAHIIGFKMWVQAVQQAGTTDIDTVRQAMYGQEVKNLTGGVAVMNTNHHLSKPVLIGEIQDDGQIETVWRTDGLVVGDAWSDFIPESAKLTADWTYPCVCDNCTKPKYLPINWPVGDAGGRAHTSALPAGVPVFPETSTRAARACPDDYQRPDAASDRSSCCSPSVQARWPPTPKSRWIRWSRPSPPRVSRPRPRQSKQSPPAATPRPHRFSRPCSPASFTT